MRRVSIDGPGPLSAVLCGGLHYDAAAASPLYRAQPWTVEPLAEESGLSRSAFAAAFRDLAGEAPMRHLAARRMQAAARLLAGSALPHSRIARRVGYQSTVGFHLAFKQWHGLTPGEFRKNADVLAGENGFW
nr:AraC family transcriptional regulator [Nonomuraea sp. K271]